MPGLFPSVSLHWGKHSSSLPKLHFGSQKTVFLSGDLFLLYQTVIFFAIRHTEVQEEMFCAIFSHSLKEMHKSTELYLRVFV